MAKPSKRLIAVLSLFVLLQQFNAVFTADLVSRTRISHDEQLKRNYWEEDEDYGDVEIQENAPKRKIANKIFGTLLKKGWKLLGKASFIKKVNFVSEVTSSVTAAVSIGVSVTRAIAGCTTISPELNKNWNDFKTLDENFRKMSQNIDQINLQAKSRQIYINSSFYEYQRTRDKLEEVANEKERILESFGPEVLVGIKNTTYKIEQMVKKKNATGEKVEQLTVYLGYKEGLELTLELLFPSLSLAFTGGKVLWKKYIKDTVIGKKLVDVKDKLGDAITDVGSKGNQKFSMRIKNSKIMNTRFGKGLQKIGSTLKKGLVKVASVFKSIAKRIAPFLSLGAAAFGIWSVFSSIKECVDMGTKSKQSVVDMQKLVDETKGILANVTKANAEIQSVYQDIIGYAFSDPIIGAIKALKEMMEDETVAKKTANSAGIIKSLGAYIDTKDLDLTNDQEKQRINEVQRNANAALHSIPFTLRCYTDKGKFITAFNSECEKGSNSLPQIYIRVRELLGIDGSASNCNERTGTLVPTLEQMKSSWEKYVETHTTYSKICLMNNKAVVDAVIRELKNGLTDPTQIANRVQRANSVEEIKAMVDILKDDPRVNVLPMPTQYTICALKPTMTFEQAKMIVNANPQGRQVTKEEYDNQVCPPPQNDTK